MLITFSKYPQIIAGISERSDGSMVWENQLPVSEDIRKNRDQYFKQSKINPKRVVAGGIAHGTNVVIAGEQDAGKYLLNTDALITNVPNLFLTITVADCMPIFCFDPNTLSFGIAHAGWKGLIGGIVENFIQKFRGSYSSKQENLVVVIGPHIKNCHYEVGTEVANKFAEKSIENRDGHLYANLSKEAEMRLRRLGVKEISISEICTYNELEQFYSARRDKVKPLQGMVAYIGLR